MTMGAIIAKTFGGLTREYLTRQLVFGAALGLLNYWMFSLGKPASVGLLAWIVINTLLYPYARFIWESIVGFITGGNVFFIPAIVLMVAKFITMMLCWRMAILIAPVGLAYLFWHHSRRAA